MKRSSSASKKAKLNKLKEQKRQQIVKDLRTNQTLTDVVERAAYLMATDKFFTPESGDQLECVLSLLNEELFEEVIEERVANNLCNNVKCKEPQIEPARVKQLLKSTFNVKNLVEQKRKEANNKDTAPKVEDKKRFVFCSDGCKSEFTKTKKAIQTENESSVIGFTSQSNLFAAASILEEYSQKCLSSEVFVQRMEKKKIESVLEAFNKQMESLKVKIVEKDTSAALNEIKQVSEKAKLEADNKERRFFKDELTSTSASSTSANGLARPRFSVDIKINPGKVAPPPEDADEESQKPATQPKTEQIDTKTTEKTTEEVIDTQGKEKKKNVKKVHFEEPESVKTTNNKAVDGVPSTYAQQPIVFEIADSDEENDEEQGSQSAENESQASSQGADPMMFNMNELRSELENCENEMSTFSKINILFCQIATNALESYLKRGAQDHDKCLQTLPATNARDFFLESLQVEKYMTKVDKSYKTVIWRELNTVVHMLDIRAVPFSFDTKEWLSMTRIILTLVCHSLELPLKSGIKEKEVAVQVREEIGELNPDEQILINFLR